MHIVKQNTENNKLNDEYELLAKAGKTHKRICFTNSSIFIEPDNI